MSDTVIHAENLSKLYRIGLSEQRHESLASAAMATLMAPIRNFRNLSRLDTFGDAGNGREDSEDLLWALRDVSFEVQRGEVLGIVGRNGAGKSTLLKLLSRVTEPTRGRIRMRGRVSALLEVGTGFHPELTGRENVYLNGTILGMTKREIDRKFDEIVDFSGVEKFLDTPIKRYSSGMKVRLAFSVAAHLEPEILIVDEVLAVGDADFQRKCIGKMQEVATGEGRTILFVSHNMGAVQALCSHGIFIDQGRVMHQGTVEETISIYLEKLSSRAQIPLREREVRGGNGEARITDLALTDPDGRPLTLVTSGCDCTLSFTYQARRSLNQPTFLGTIYNSMGVALTHFTSDHAPFPPDMLPDRGVVQCRFPRLPLSPGSYRLNIAISDTEGLLDHVDGALCFEVEWGDYYQLGRHSRSPGNMVLTDSRWEFTA